MATKKTVTTKTTANKAGSLPAAPKPAIMVDLAGCATAQEEALVSIETTKELANKIVKQLYGAKVVIGDLRNCAYAQAFRDAMTGKVSAKTGKAYTLASIKNMLSAIRQAVKTGKPVDWNASRTKAKTAPKTTGTVKGTSTTAKSSVSKADTKAGDVATTETLSTTEDKVLVQLRNALTICQSAKEARFDLPKMTTELQKLITLVELGTPKT